MWAEQREFSVVFEEMRTIYVSTYTHSNFIYCMPCSVFVKSYLALKDTSIGCTFHATGRNKSTSLLFPPHRWKIPPPDSVSCEDLPNQNSGLLIHSYTSFWLNLRICEAATAPLMLNFDASRSRISFLANDVINLCARASNLSPSGLLTCTWYRVTAVHQAPPFEVMQNGEIR